MKNILEVPLLDTSLYNDNKHIKYSQYFALLYMFTVTVLHT